MELKPGYKQTEIGVIPDEWAISALKSISALISKGSTPTTYGHGWVSDGVVFLRSECVTGDGLDLSQSMFISEAAHTMLRRSETCDGDLLMTITGNVGRVVQVRNIGRANLNQHIARIRVNNKDVDSVYVLQYLSQPKVRRIFESITTGQAYPQISLRQVREAKLPLPKSSEQKAIAEALSDVDALIDSLEALLTKKRNIKTGVMQELLTGRTRLPGFTGDWKEVRLGELSEISMATSKKSRVDGQGKYIIADMGSVSKEGSFLTHKTTDVREDVLCIGDLVMPKDDIGGGQIIGKAVVVPHEERYVLGDHVYRLRLSHGCPDFVRYAINSYKVNTLLRSKVVGSAQLGLGRRAVLEQPIDLPPLKEQEAIAAVLSDIDAEIEALDKRLAKTRDLKQGMAQELLTGRTRLV